MGAEVSSEYLWRPLPPQDAWLIDPEEKIETPTDDRGLIDVDRLIVDVKATVDPSYTWRGDSKVHHLYWPASIYPYGEVQSQPSTAHVFRNLPVNKALIPRVFENWLHKITTPPEVPDEEVMRNQIDAWDIAKHLFASGRDIVANQRLARRRRAFIAANPHVLRADFNGEDIIGEEYIQSEFDRCFNGLDMHQARYDESHPDFRLVDIDVSTRRVMAELGSIVVPGSLVKVKAVTG